MVHSQREQVQVGDLVVALDPREVDAGVVAQSDVIGPELVVERAAGFAEACADPLHRQPAGAAVGRQAHHPDHAVLHHRATGDLGVVGVDEGLGPRRELMGIVEEGDPDVDIEQRTRAQMPSRSINSRTCAVVTTSPRAGSSANRPLSCARGRAAADRSPAVAPRRTSSDTAWPSEIRSRWATWRAAIKASSSRLTVVRMGAP